MRLLLLGSLLVLLSVAGWGALQWSVMFAPAGPAPPVPPVFRFVNFGRDANAAHADAVVAHLDDPKRFSRAKSVGCYFGLVPCQDQSGAKNRL
jgi:hypothetical protein